MSRTIINIIFASNIFFLIIVMYYSGYCLSPRFTDIGSRQNLDDPSDDGLTDLHHYRDVLVAVLVTQDGVYNHLKGEAGLNHGPGLIQLSLYDPGLQLLVSTGIHNIPSAQVFEFGIPEIQLSKGLYWIRVTWPNEGSLNLKNRRGRYISVFQDPIPHQTSLPEQWLLRASEMQLPDITLGVKTDKHHNQPVLLERLDPIYAFCMDEFNYIYGFNSESRMIVSSNDFGGSWNDLFRAPNFRGHFYGMTLANHRLFAFSSLSEIYEWSLPVNQLDETGAWLNRSCPDNLMHPSARLRPYDLVYFRGYLFIGEYSAATTGELVREDGKSKPRVFKFSLESNQWSLSGEFEGRHIHAFWADGDQWLWASIGDWNWGTDVGLARLAGEDVQAQDGWKRWTCNIPPYTDYYGVDLIGVGSDLILAGDRPGIHLLRVPKKGSPGLINMDPLLWSDNQNPGETVRAVTADEVTGDLYYFSAETKHIGLYRTAFPYLQSELIHEYDENPVVLKSFICGPFLFNRNQRIRIR